MSRRDFGLPALLVLALLVLLAAPLVGPVRIDPLRAWHEPGSLDGRILWALRLPRIALGFAAGSALALAGLALQALFRNPLATPYTLGISSGAALGASLWIAGSLPWALAIGGLGAAPAALLGAAAASVLVWGLGRRARAGDGGLLLAGVAVNFSLSSLILLLQLRADLSQSLRILRWLVGALESAPWSAIAALGGLSLGATLALAALHRELDLLAAGGDIAWRLGAHPVQLRRLLFAVSSLLVAGTVALCGPIGFVGLMTPHMARLLLGMRHRRLVPACALLGGAFLVACDGAARTLAAPLELPVGAVTALLGGPFFLMLLVGRGRRRSP
jgi:iron complex transport system permease protein